MSVTECWPLNDPQNLVILSVMKCLSLSFKFQENTFDENEHRDETLEETIARQQQIIKKLENQLKVTLSSSSYFQTPF